MSKRATQGLQPIPFKDRDELENHLRTVNILKNSISDAMIVVMDLYNSAADVVNTIYQACLCEKNNLQQLVIYFFYTYSNERVYRLKIMYLTLCNNFELKVSIGLFDLRRSV